VAGIMEKGFFDKLAEKGRINIKNQKLTKNLGIILRVVSVLLIIPSILFLLWLLFLWHGTRIIAAFTIFIIVFFILRFLPIIYFSFKYGLLIRVFRFNTYIDISDKKTFFKWLRFQALLLLFIIAISLICWYFLNGGRK
jgi:hypothetical protein